MDWKETVTSVTNRVLPGVNSNVHEKITENEVMSNLPLQMSLYFNVIMFPFWALTVAILLYDKFNCYGEFTKFVIVTITVAVSLIEILRLYLGYEGNLRDKVPELAGFWMLSVLLQLPLQGFLLLNPFFLLRILDLVVQGTMFTLLVVQSVSGYCALKYTTKQQAIYFRIMKLRSETDQSSFLHNSRKVVCCANSKTVSSANPSAPPSDSYLNNSEKPSVFEEKLLTQI